MEGKVVGLDALGEEAKRSGKFDYDKPIEGLQAPSRYEFVLKLIEPDYNMLYILAMPATGRMAREVVEQYGDAITEHPVGTGPSSSGYGAAPSSWCSRPIPISARSTSRPRRRGRARPRDRAHLKGKRLPLGGRIEQSVIEEHQPRWLAFLNASTSTSARCRRSSSTSRCPAASSRPTSRASGIEVRPDEIAWITYTTFNMNDPVVGGYTPEKIALRRAMSMAYPIQDEIAIIYKNQATECTRTSRPEWRAIRPRGARRSSTARPRRRRSSTCTATSTATATAGARCPTARRS
jgi:hypothetical protein